MTHDSDTRRSALGDARRQLSVAWHYLLQALKMRMAYRLDFFVECLSSLVAEATGLIVIWVIFQNTPALGGWDQWQRKAFQEMWSKAGSFVATEGIAADRAQFVNENAPKRNSRFVIQMLCNGKLRQHAVPCILEDVEFMDERNEYAFALHVVPENLLGAMWIQFAQSVGGNVDFRRCGACQEWFRVSPDVRRGHARYCGDARRMKSYRRRMERARRMHAEGVALERIAEELGTTDETVRGWLFGKAGTTQ